MKKLTLVLLTIMMVISMTPVFAITTGLSPGDFKNSRKLLVEMFLEPE